MAANTGQTPPDNEWLASLQEDILEPDLPIIDPHHHLWLRGGYSYLMPEFAQDLACGHKLVATVFAECHSMYRAQGPQHLRSLGETEFVRGQAAMAASGEFGPTQACQVMFGNVDLTLGAEVEAVLERHLEAAGDGFKGVRISCGWHPDDKIGNVAAGEGLLLEPSVGQAVSVLEGMNLSLDVWPYHTQLDEVAQLAERHPGVSLILNHVGSPILGGPYRGQRDRVFAEWKAGIQNLAKQDNVVVKLGALPIRMPDFAGDRTRPPGSEEVAAAWQPWMETCIEAFGAHRCMYESNFPVQKRWCSYQVCWNAFKRISQGASSGEKADLFAGTAARVYRMETNA